MSKKQISGKKNIFWDIVFVLVLAMLPFLHLFNGVEFTDTAYSLGNFENLKNMNLTWTVAVFWANLLGKMFTLLPMGHTWIGMKFYTTLIPVATALISYFTLKKYIPRILAFAGEVFAIALLWCPTTLVYNYLTYLLFTIAVILLVKSLEKESKILLMAAGAVIAFNVFVRFPNVSEVILIVVIWLDGMINKRKKSVTIRNTFLYLCGFLAGILINFLVITVMYGFDSIPHMVVSLFAMTGENKGYSPIGMIMAMLESYYSYTKSFVLLIGLTLVAFMLGYVTKKHWLKIAICVIQILMFSMFVVWGLFNETPVFTLDYSKFESMEFWLATFLILCNIFSVWSLLRKRTQNVHKLWALSVLVIVWITPIGSNNSLYPAYNNLFLVAPIVLYMIWEELFKGRNFYELLDMESKYSMIASRITIFLLIVCTLFQGIMFGVTFVYKDSGFPFKSRYAIENNEVLKGMHTNAENAALIYELTSYAKNNGYENRKAIFYGDIPGLEYILKMPCAISHTWPDQGSFGNDEFESDINNLPECPIVFVNEEVCSDIFDLTENATQKECILSEYLTVNNYILKVRIRNIAIYSAD